jgi:hypothetical protein
MAISAAVKETHTWNNHFEERAEQRNMIFQKILKINLTYLPLFKSIVEVSKWVTNGYKTWNMWYSNLGRKKHLFRDISSTNIDTLVPSLCQCVETSSIKIFSDCCLSHFHASVSTQLWTVLRDKHFPPQIWNISLWISVALSHFAHKKRTRERCFSVVHSSSMVAVLTTETSLWACAWTSPT